MKILLIEDDQYTSELIAGMLFAHCYAVDVIADGAAGFELAVQWHYDLILLDILLPGLNGIDVCRRLRSQGCQTPILMLTAKDSNADIVAGLDAGADDYLAKTCEPSQLLARVRALLRRGSGAAATPVLTWGALCLDPALAQVTYDQKVIALRPKEYALLELFLRNPHRTLSRSAIIEHLWSMDDTPVEGSITNLIKDLRQRLKSAGMVADLIETVYGLGYRLKPAPAGADCLSHIRLGTGQVPNHTQRLTWDRRSPQPSLRMQQITERFHDSLQSRIEALEIAKRALQTGNFSLEQRQATCADAHKLAGGLGTFGCMKASEIAHAIENLLVESLTQEALLTHQLSELVEALKQELQKQANLRSYRERREVSPVGSK